MWEASLSIPRTDFHLLPAIAAVHDRGAAGALAHLVHSDVEGHGVFHCINDAEHAAAHHAAPQRERHLHRVGDRVIQELLEILIDSNKLGLELNEIEGDAILFYTISQQNSRIYQIILNCKNHQTSRIPCSRFF